MVDTEQEEGPKVVWTFPLARQFQSDRGILQLGTRLGNVISSDSGMLNDGPVRERVKEKRESITGSESDSEYGQDDSTAEIEEEIDDLNESSSSIFDSDSGEDEDLELSEGPAGPAVVSIEDGVFIPSRVNISPGDTVTWENNNDQVHRVVGTQGEEFDSGQLEPGESYEHTFDEEEATVYIDTIAGGDQMSGAVIVGDAALEGDLPSDASQDPVPLDAEESGTSATRTMAQAAEDKDDMDIGFDN